MLRYFIWFFSYLIIGSCSSDQPIKSIQLVDFAYNKMVFPDSVFINDQIYHRNFDLAPTETFTIRTQTIEDILKGVVETSYNYYPITINMGTCTLDGCPFQIGLIDENRNKVFNDVGIDKVIFMPQNADSIYYYTNIYGPVFTLDSSNIVEINNQTYQLIAHASSLELNEVDGHSDSIQCEFNSCIPDVAVTDEFGAHKPLTDYKENGKKLLIELWYNGCRGCVKILPKLKSLDTSKISLVSLNVIDDQITVTNFKNRNDIQWPMLTGDKALLQSIGNLGYYPSAVIYDENGVLEDLSSILE